MEYPQQLSAFLEAAGHWLVSHWPLILVPILGCASIYTLLPRPRPFSPLVGAALGTLALVLTGVLIVQGGGAWIESLLFYAFSAIAIVAGTILVTQHNPARAALSFTLVILSTCGLFLILAAPFLMAATIIIYAGAIVVTFLFVLMLAQQAGLSDADLRSREPLFASIAGFLLLGALFYVLDGVFSPRGYEQKMDRLNQDIADIRQAAKQPTAAEINQAVGEHQELIGRFKKTLLALDLKKQSDDVENEVQSRGWPEPRPGNEAKMKELLDELLTIGASAQAQARLGRAQVGFLRPLAHGDRPARMSSFSGPPPTTPADELRFDPQSGVPLLPAENSTYLGRSLFTDYLFPVELGGFLLLVAVVGAIAIAQRSSRVEPEGLRPATPLLATRQSPPATHVGVERNS